jgi:GNAT superfamily N-acetyltransferase
LITINPRPDHGALHNLEFFLRDLREEVVGGLLGHINWKWLSIDVFWVAESLRRIGLGAQLLREAEEFALAHDCCFAHVETYSFQARGFYEKHGYRLFGRLDNYPLGHRLGVQPRKMILKVDRSWMVSPRTWVFE